jgi:hypothetical protein
MGLDDGIMRENVHGVVLCVPTTERDVTVQTRSEIVAWVLGGVYKACTGHLIMSVH